ncbi:energy transducer TonB [bacterium]|nr:energy transducer TonB [bacterium]
MSARATLSAAPRAWRRIRSDTNLGFVLSLGLHLLLFLLLGSFSARRMTQGEKLTEIAYIEQRYGEAVAKKVSLAPEKLAPAVTTTPAETPQLEGSLFAKDKPTGAPAGPELAAPPPPLPTPREAPNPFTAPTLTSRQRRSEAPALPRVSEEQLLLSAGLTDNPRRVLMGAEDVNLKGKVLVGRSSRLGDDALFKVESGEAPALAGGALTLAVPEGGLVGGHPELVGGQLAEGKQAYRGALPGGNLVAKDASRERLTALSSLQVGGKSPAGDELAGTGIAEPGRGAGLISRGGSDAVTRGGSLLPRREGSEARPAPAVPRSIEPERPAVAAAAVPAPTAGPGGAQAEKDVSMTLSGPILDREVLASQAPSYPAAAKQQGWQGTVSVYFTVRPDGTVKKVLIEKASPHQVLDEAAKRCLEHWRFSALPTGATAEQWGVLTIVFRLR